jgi:hypothetical protein
MGTAGGIHRARIAVANANSAVIVWSDEDQDAGTANRTRRICAAPGRDRPAISALHGAKRPAARAVRVHFCILGALQAPRVQKRTHTVRFCITRGAVNYNGLRFPRCERYVLARLFEGHNAQRGRRASAHGATHVMLTTVVSE